MSFDFNTIGTAMLSAISGGSLLKVAEFWLTKSKARLDKNKQDFDEDKSFREEYRNDIRDLRGEVEKIKDQYNKERELRRKAEDREDQWKDYARSVILEFRLFKIDMKEQLRSNGIEVSDQLFIPIEMPKFIDSEESKI